MNQEKIQQLEAEVKDLFVKSENKNWRTFWSVHLKPVIEYSKQMAEKYGANFEAVWAGAILHDIAKITNEEPHDEIGSRKAYAMILEKGFDEDFAQKVKQIVLKHRCRNYPPESLEEKIVASADAMAHFIPPFHLWMFESLDKDFSQIMESGAKKIKRDFEEKIFFEDERKQVEKQYEVLKGWFEFKM